MVGESRIRKIRGNIFNRNSRGNVFTKMVVDMWKKLPKEVVEAGTIATFKRHLDTYVDRKSLE